MDTIELSNWIFPVMAIFVAIILFLIGFVVNLTAKHNREITEYKEANFNLRSIKEEIGIIAELIKSPGVMEAVTYFATQDPQKISDSIKHILELNQQLQKQEGQLKQVIKLAMKHLFNEVRGKIHELIEGNKSFTERLDEYKKSKLFLKNNYLQSLEIQKVLRNEDSIFIESGSTLAYLILPLIADFENLRGGNETPLKICTNNVLIYMILLFIDGINPVLLKGIPRNKYGATFGVEGKTDLCIKENVIDFLKENQVTTLFTTTSVLDLKCGPHVGSIPNQQLKNALFYYFEEQDVCKNFTFIVTEKINNALSEGKIGEECKFVFNDKPETSVVEHPSVESAVEFRFRKMLDHPQNFLVTASEDRRLFEQVRDELKEKFPFLESWQSPNEIGGLGVFFKN